MDIEEALHLRRDTAEGGIILPMKMRDAANPPQSESRPTPLRPAILPNHIGLILLTCAPTLTPLRSSGTLCLAITSQLHGT